MIDHASNTITKENTQWDGCSMCKIHLKSKFETNEIQMWEHFFYPFFPKNRKLQKHSIHKNIYGELQTSKRTKP